MAVQILLLCLGSAARGELPSSYLMVGKAECVTAEGITTARAGQSVDYFVAITTKRAMVGWTIENDGRHSGEIFRYASNKLKYPVSFEFGSAPNGSMLVPVDRTLETAVQQKTRLVDTSASRLAALEIGVFGKYPFALFFQSDYWGIGRHDVVELLKNGGGTKTTVCGSFTLSEVDGKVMLQLLQSSDDAFTARGSQTKVRDAKFEPFQEKGIRSVSHSCAFSSLPDEAQVEPWTSTCETEYIGFGGERVYVAYRVTVDFWSSDESVANDEIEKVLALVPEREEVIASGPIEYVWERDEVAKRIDTTALEQAEELAFSKGGWRRRLFFATNVLIVLTLLTVIVFKARRRG